MIRSARATALLVLIAAATHTVEPAQAGWLDWSVPSDKAAKIETARPDPGQTQQTVTVERGDTLGKILARAGVLSAESARVLEAMRDLVDPKRLQIGDTVAMTLADAGGQIRLSALHVDFRPDLSLTLVRGQDGAFLAATVNGQPSVSVETVTGKVSKSLRGSMTQAGLPSTLADDVIRALEYDPTLPKRIKTGTEFQLIYERLGAASAGRKASDRLRLRYAEITIGKTPHRFYHYAPQGAEPKFFDESGRSLEAIRRTKNFVEIIDLEA